MGIMIVKSAETIFDIFLSICILNYKLIDEVLFMKIALNNAYIPDFENMRFNRACVGIEGDRIVKISDSEIDADKKIDLDGAYLTPGLIDCHCHIESSYLVPFNFGNEIAQHATLHAVCDCHEIANVKGAEGLRFFMSNAEQSLCNLKFAVSSCVPATAFATSGGELSVDDIDYFLQQDDVVALGELMNVYGVANREDRFVEIIKLAKKYKKRVNGHAPHLEDDLLDRYISAGVEDDHESESYDELKKKIEKGLYVFIREGSAEQTEDDAYRIINEYPDRVMFCSDDKTIADIMKYGHMNYNLKKAISLGIEPILAVKVATYNGLKYYNLDAYSQVKEGYFADLAVFDEKFNVKNVIVKGEFIDKPDVEHTIPKQFINTIQLSKVNKIPDIEHKQIAIKAKSSSLITDKLEVDETVDEYDLDRDLLKLCVFERYGHNRKSACRIKGFGLKAGAMASSLAHDCHNVVAVGVNDEAIKIAVNSIIEMQGGLVLFDGRDIYSLRLDVGGVVSSLKPDIVVDKLRILNDKAHEIGSTLKAPFETLSFMALEVIPHIKLTDKGLFDVDRFSYVEG